MKKRLFVIIFFAFPYTGFVFAQSSANGRAAQLKRGDYNRDGKTDSVDQGILWFLSRSKYREFEGRPEIKSFAASPGRITIGGETALRWDVEGLPDSLVIDNGVGNVSRQFSVRVRPSRTTTYTLTARNSFGSAAAETTVVVMPRIVSFNASPSVIQRGGGSSRLRWRILGDHSCVQINNGLGEVTGQTSVQVSSAGTYTLRVFYALDVQSPCSGSYVSRSVNVNGPPRISFFRASPSAVGRGAASALSWNVQGEAYQVSINQGVGDVTGLTTVDVYPESTTTYTLTAVNEYGRTVKNARVEVLNLPVIESFRAGYSLINDVINSSDDPPYLIWEISGAGSIQLNVQKIDGEGNRTAVSSCRNLNSRRRSCIVELSETTSYILTAGNSLGEVESDIVTIGFLEFKDPTPVSITEGESSLLSWEGSEFAEVLEIEKREDGERRYGSPVDAAGLDNYEVSPDVTTSYRLKAKPYDSDEFLYSKAQVVRVGNVTSFRADPPFVVKYDNPAVSANAKTREGNTRLRWSLAHITSPRISLLKTVGGDETDISSSCRTSGCTVTPDEDEPTEYTLRVRDSGSLDLQRQLTVNILKISRFKGSLGSSESTSCRLRSSEGRAVGSSAGAVVECLTASEGQDINLSWEGFSGYDSLMLEACELESASDSSCTKTTETVTDDEDKSIEVSPSGYSTIYTLLAEKEEGGYSKTVKLNVRVRIQNQAQVNAFSADDRIIQHGSSDRSVILSWDIVGKDPVDFELLKELEGESQTSIWERESPRSSKQSRYTYSFDESSDQKTTEFTLTADNDFGSESEKTLKVYYLKMGSFTAAASDDSSNSSSAAGCSGADHCLTVTSGTGVDLSWGEVEGFGDERRSSCGRSGQPGCITDTLEITWDKDSDSKITLTDNARSQSLSGASASNRISRAPVSTAVYTLTAKKEVGEEEEEVSKTVKVIVQDAPSVSSLTAREASLNTSALNRILDDAETETYLHYTHTGKDAYNLKIEEKPHGERSFVAGDGFNRCSSVGSCAYKNSREVSPAKTTEYRLTLEKPEGTVKDTRTIKVYKLGIGEFKAQTSSTNKSSDSDCTGADECLTVTRNQRVAFSWSDITGFEDERSGDSIQILKSQSDACSSSSYEDDSNPSSSGSVAFSASGVGGECVYTLKVQKTLGSGDDEETDSAAKTIKVSVDNPASIDYFESRRGASRADNTNIQRIIQNSGSTTLLWKIFSFTSSDTFKLKRQKEGESSAEFEDINPACANTDDSPSFVECSYTVSSIDKTTTYTLEAVKGSSQKVTSRPIKVYVLKTASFEGTRRKNGAKSTDCIVQGGDGECISIEQGADERVELEWMIEGFGGEGADTLEIKPNVQTGHGISSCTGDPCKMNVKGRSSIYVRPTATTIYTLTAKKVIGDEEVSHSKKVKITLGTRPEINSSAFKLVVSNTAKEICRNTCGNADLEWEVSGDDISKVTIIKESVSDSGEKETACVRGDYPDCTDLSGGGGTLSDSHSQSITRTTKYTLRAENAVGSVSQNIKVKIFKVKSFTASLACISSGGSSVLSWEVAEGVNGASSVEINNSVGSLSSRCSLVHGIESVCTGSESVNPTATLSYQLTAKTPSTTIADLVHGTAARVQVGSCPTGAAPPSRKVSSLLQDCPVCPKMTSWSALNVSKMFGGDSSSSVLNSQYRWIGSSQSDLEPYLQQQHRMSSYEEKPVPESSEADEALSSDAADSSLKKSGRDSSEEQYYISSGKITHGEYQVCIDEGACSSMTSFAGGSLSVDEEANIEELYEERPPDALQSTLLQEQRLSYNSGMEDAPVKFISLRSAMEYARWLSEKTGKPQGVLADPVWADEFEKFSIEILESPPLLSPVYNQNGVLLYAVHPKELAPSVFYEGLMEYLLAESGQNYLTDISALDVSAEEGEAHLDPAGSSADSEAVFRSGFHIVRPL